MPIRLYKCPICGSEMQELHFGVYPNRIKCKCGKDALLKWTAPSLVKTDFRPGFDIGLGRHFETKRQRDNYTAAHNISEVKDISGSEKRWVPEEKSRKLAFLREREARLKRG